MDSILPIRQKIARVALRPSARCLSHIIKLQPATTVGILGYSHRFTELLFSTCEMYTENVNISEPLVVTSDDTVAEYLKGKDVILVPKSYEKYFSTTVIDILRTFKGDVVDCYYEMDEGSILYLETKIKRLLEKKTL